MPEQLETVYRRLVDAWNAGDVEAIVAEMDDEVVIESLLTPVEGGYHGHEGVRRWWQSFYDAFPDWRVELLDIRSAGDRIVAKIRVSGHGNESGLAVEVVTWHDVRRRNGKLVHLFPHATEAEADASLQSPKDAPADGRPVR